MAGRDRMKQPPDILMPHTVVASLELSGKKEAYELRPDEILVGGRKDTFRVFVFDGTRLPEITAAVDAALEEAAEARLDYDELRTDFLTAYSNILAGMKAGLEQVQADQARNSASQ